MIDDPLKWQLIKKIVADALDLQTPDRDSFVRRACGLDEELLAEVQSLVALEIDTQTTKSHAIELSIRGRQTGSHQVDAGSCLGPYRIEAKLGAGGMGEVYLARDTRLGRAVAIKILCQQFSPRFKREAQAIAQLNHPNICTLYDIGPNYLVMEWINGRTLKDWIAAGPREFDETVDIAWQLAQGLRAAHNSGVLHRDIKPANVMVTSDGLVKIMDFGLAKISCSIDGEEDGTITGPLTAPGSVMGTPSYMSPEQVAGGPVDHRSDIWSLGVVLYEMVTGQRPFRADPGLPILRAILDDEPQPISALRASTPSELNSVVLKALAKNPSARYQQIDELLADLAPLRESSPARARSAQRTGAFRIIREVGLSIRNRNSFARRQIWWFIGSIALALLVAEAFHRSENTSTTGVPQKVVSLTSYPGSEDFGSFAPDGSQIAFTWDGPRHENTDIYVKTVEGGLPLRLTKDPAPDVAPAWSPDGRWIAFIRADKVFLVSPLGGPERRLADLEADTLAWTADGKALGISARLSHGELNSIYLVSIATGEMRRLTMPSGSLGDRDPSFSPDGKALAFVRWSPPIGCGVYICDFVENSCRNPRRVTRDSEIYGLTWTPDGREIVFSANRNGVQGLWRVQAYSSTPARLVTGLPGSARRPVISRPARGASNPIPTRLAYTEKIDDYNIWRMDLRGAAVANRKAVAEPLIVSTQVDISPEFSPDGRRIAFVSDRSGNKEVWICDSDGSNPQQLTFLGTEFGEGSVILYADGSPRWSPDGTRIAFHAISEGKHRIYVIGASGGSPRRVSPEAFDAWRPAWSRNGRWLYFSSNRSGTVNLWKAPLDGSEAAVQVTKSVGFDALESPDGKYLFFFAEGGRWEGDYPASGSTLWSMPLSGGPQVSVLQGVQPTRWAMVNRGIYFLDIRTELPGRPDSRAIKFFSFETHKVEQIGIIEKKSLPSWKSNSYAGSLSVSADGRWIIWPQLDRDESDLMLVNNFR